MFLGAVLNQGFLYAALFAYLAGATYVLQDIYGLSPQQYALAFGLNSAGFMVFGYLAGRAAERWSIARHPRCRHRWSPASARRACSLAGSRRCRCGW